jgi:hypothetical protein
MFERIHEHYGNRGRRAALMLYRHTHILEFLNGFVRVGYLEGDVVNALAVRIEKFLPGCVVADRLDQFQRDLPEIQECELCLPVGWVSPVHELRFVAGFDVENPRWSDAQNRCPTPAGGFDVAADNRHLRNDLHARVVICRALGGGQTGEQGQNECQFLHASIFTDGTLGFKGGAATVAGIAAIRKVRPAMAVQSWACEARLLNKTLGGTFADAKLASVGSRPPLHPQKAEASSQPGPQAPKSIFGSSGIDLPISRVYLFHAPTAYPSTMPSI